MISALLRYLHQTKHTVDRIIQQTIKKEHHYLWARWTTKTKVTPWLASSGIGFRAGYVWEVGEVTIVLTEAWSNNRRGKEGEWKVARRWNYKEDGEWFGGEGGVRCRKEGDSRRRGGGDTGSVDKPAVRSSPSCQLDPRRAQYRLMNGRSTLICPPWPTPTEFLFIMSNYQCRFIFPPAESGRIFFQLQFSSVSLLLSWDSVVQRCLKITFFFFGGGDGW